MLGDLKKLTCAVMSVVVLTFGLVVAPPAEAQNQGGLVNVNISGNNIAVPISIGAALNLAANICNTQVGVLSAQLAKDNTASCTNQQTGAVVTLTKVTQQQ